MYVHVYLCITDPLLNRRTRSKVSPPRTYEYRKSIYILSHTRVFYILRYVRMRHEHCLLMGGDARRVFEAARFQPAAVDLDGEELDDA